MFKEPNDFLPLSRYISMKGKIKFRSKEKSDFFGTLKTRIDQYFENNRLSKKGNKKNIAKTLILLSLYFLPYFIIILGEPTYAIMLGCYILMGIGIAGIGFSIMHDANHGSYSSNQKLNDLVGLSLNVIGGYATTWKLQHNILHHTYTNIHGMDDDIRDRGILRFSPGGKKLKIQRYQHIYAPLLYSLSTISWVLLKDFGQLIRYNKTGLVRAMGYNPWLELMLIILTKFLYLFYMLWIPIVVIGLRAGQVFTGFLIMHLLAGFILSIIFQLAHVVEGPGFPAENHEGNIENNWAIHQMETTANFSKSNTLLSWYVGGLNYQVEHHLFPKISHVHYPAISEIVKSTANEFMVPYHEYPDFTSAFKSHLKVLKTMGRS